MLKHAMHDVREKFLIMGPALLGARSKTVLDELFDHVAGRVAGHLELIKCLQCGETRGAALFVSGPHGCGAKRDFNCISAMQARAAPPPLSIFSGPARRNACSSSST